MIAEALLLCIEENEAFRRRIQALKVVDPLGLAGMQRSELLKRTEQRLQELRAELVDCQSNCASNKGVSAMPIAETPETPETSIRESALALLGELTREQLEKLVSSLPSDAQAYVRNTFQERDALLKDVFTFPDVRASVITALTRGDY